MSIRLLSVSKAKDWLKITHDFDDVAVELAILGASKAVLNYVDLSESDFTDSSGEQALDSDGEPTDVEEILQLATAVLVGIQLRDPSGADAKGLEYGRLPPAVTSLLYGHRTTHGFA